MISKQFKKILPYLTTIGALIVIAYLFRIIALYSTEIFSKTILTVLRSVIHISLVALWCASIARRVVNINVRRLLLAIGILMLFWILSKTIKIDFFPNVTDVAIRYMWYGYYIPMILIPLLGIFITLHIGKPNDYKKPKWVYLFLIPALLLLIGIFTNDLHNWAFTFPNGIENFNDDYVHGVLFWITVVWFTGLGLTFAVLLVSKGRLPGSKKMQNLPVYIIMAAIVFWVLYVTRVIDADLTIMDCLIIIALLESAMQMGLIPINTNYGEVFSSTTVPVIIVDDKYQVKYSSGGAMPVCEKDMRDSAIESVSLGDSILSSAAIRGGRVVWQDDISKLNQQKLELDEIYERLSEEGILIQAENEVKEKQAQADEKSLLYDKIAREVSDQLTKVLNLISKAENGEDTRENLARVAIIGCYIKRRGNLILLSKEKCLVPSSDLVSAIKESMDNLKLLGIKSALDTDVVEEIVLSDALKIFGLYQEVVELFMNQMTSTFIRLKADGEKIILSLEIGVNGTIPQETINTLERNEDLLFEIDDEAVWVTIRGGDVK